MTSLYEYTTDVPVCMLWLKHSNMMHFHPPNSDVPMCKHCTYYTVIMCTVAYATMHVHSCSGQVYCHSTYIHT